MMPFASPSFGRGDSLATLLATVTIADGGSSPTPASLGAAIGDLAVVLAQFGGPISSGSAGTWSSQTVVDSFCKVFWRSLTAGDMGAGIAVSRGGTLTVYRGAAGLVQATTGSASGSAHSATATGFTRSAYHGGLYAVTRSTAAGFDDVGIGAPSGFASRGGSQFYAGGVSPSTATAIRAFDRLTPPNELYISAASFTFNWTGSSGNFYLSVFELRVP